MSGLFVCLLFSLASLQQIAATRASPNNLQHETQQTLQQLEDLPSHCTRDLRSEILTKQSQLPAQVFYCSISTIVIDLAEVLVDTFFFGFEAYEAVPALLDDLKALKGCLNKDGAEAVLTCAVEYLPGTVQAGEVIVSAVENYAGEIKLMLPLLWQEIQQCRDEHASQYKALLQSVLTKATTCAQ